MLWDLKGDKRDRFPSRGTQEDTLQCGGPSSVGWAETESAVKGVRGAAPRLGREAVRVGTGKELLGLHISCFRDARELLTEDGASTAVSPESTAVNQTDMVSATIVNATPSSPGCTQVHRKEAYLDLRCPQAPELQAYLPEGFLGYAETQFGARELSPTVSQLVIPVPGPLMKWL